MLHYHYIPTSFLLQWTIPNRAQALRASIAMNRIEQYLAAARFQMDRIESRLDRHDKARPVAGYHEPLPQAFCEIHFYFICWNAIVDMIKELAQHSGCAAARSFWRRRHRILERYATARHHLEHFTEQLPRKNTQKPEAKLHEMGFVQRGSFTLAGQRWDVSRASFTRLERMIGELNKQFRAEAMTRHQAMEVKGRRNP